MTTDIKITRVETHPSLHGAFSAIAFSGKALVATQWGKTADEAARNLHDHCVYVQGFSWPQIEKDT